MDGLFARPTTGASPVEGEESFTALVAYEDVATRDRAMKVCDRLVQKFWSDLKIDLSWWRFDFLCDAGMVEAATDAAACSDVILFSAHAGRELPSVVEGWIERWVSRRGLRNGILVAMIGTGEDRLKGLTPIHVYLREVAQRAGMDYLPQVVDAALGELDSSIEMINRRAEKLTSVLDNILHRRPIPRRWGINP